MWVLKQFSKDREPSPVLYKNHGVKVFVDKNAVIGELLYVISNYEKGRITTSKIWTRKYMESLEHSLEVMRILLLLLETDCSLTSEEMYPVFHYLRENCHKFWSGDGQTIDIINCPSNITFWATNDVNQDYRVVIDMMKKINTQCVFLVRQNGRNRKKQLYFLLHALHNLPKVFLNPQEQTLFNLGIHPISTENAIQYAKSYIDSSRTSTGTGSRPLKK